MKKIKKHVKAIIFDMDGTIIHTEHLWEDANKILLGEYGINSCTKEQEAVLAGFSGIGVQESAIRIKNAFSLNSTVSEIIEKKLSIIKHLITNEKTDFVKGFEQFHKELSLHGVSSAIATNADLDTLEKLKNKVGLDNFFGTHLYSIDHVESKAKPDPAIFLHAADKLGVLPSECVIFEDSIFGFKAAKAAGIPCIAIKGHKNSESLHEAHHSIEDYHSALDALRKIVNK